MFPSLFPFRIKMHESKQNRKSNIRESLKFSLWLIYQEAILAYVIGLDRVTIIGCRSVVERALRIVYQDKTGNIANEAWSLGPLLSNCCKVGAGENVLRLSRIVKNEGDNLAHAKHEVKKGWNGVAMKVDPKDPTGPPRAHYVTGDAKKALLSTRDLLQLIFQNPQANAQPRIAATEK